MMHINTLFITTLLYALLLSGCYADTECVDTQGYTDQWGGSCAEYESNAAWCGGYGEMGESGLTPNENCCVCKSKLVSSVSAAVTTSTTIPTIPEAAVEVEGFSYGYGWCKDCNDVVLSKVIKNYVYSSDECALFCEPFKAESSYRGYTWTDGPGNEDHCYCMVDSDSDLSSLSSKYGGDRIEQNAGSGPIGFSNLPLGKTYDAYCYAETRDTCPSDTIPTTSPPTAATISVTTSYPGDVEGFDYVGIGICRDNGEQSYPSVTQIYTFSTEECADFCMKVGVDQSLGVLRGYTWGGDISGGLQIHCNCFFDAGADTEAIASQYGGEREHWGIMEPARFSTEGQGSGIISGTAESNSENYCYKVIDSEATTVEEPWEVEEASPLSTDTPSKQMTFPPYLSDSTFFSSSNTPTVAVCPEEEAAFQSCITVDVDSIGSFVDCSLCGLEAMGDDIFDFSGYCGRWQSCVSEMCPESCVEPINAFQKCILDDSGTLGLVDEDCFDSDSTDPITDSTEDLPTDNMSPSPTANDGIDDQVCLEEETRAFEECGIYDIDNLDMAEACAMCQVEAMGDDIMNFNTDNFCNKWKACANEKCPAACIDPMNDLQVCMFQDTGMTVDCLSSPDNANVDNVNEVESSKAQRRQVITTVMIMVICGVLFV